MDIGWRIICMGKASISGRMAGYTRVNITMIRRMGMEFIHTQTAAPTAASGKTASSTVKAYL